jgi:hypothetical protein
MTDKIQVTLDREVYERLQQLMVPPVSDVNAVIKSLLFHDGHDSRAAVAMETQGRHFTLAQELERANLGIYEYGGGT